MGPALQRLLVKPSSLDLLRQCLLRSPSIEDLWKMPFKPSSPHSHNHCSQCRHHTAAQAPALAPAVLRTCCDEPAPSVVASLQSSTLEGKNYATRLFRDHKSNSRLSANDARAAPLSNIRKTQAELSPADGTNPQNDLRHWASLVELQMYQQGYRGVRKIWNDLNARGIQIPTEGPLASIFWPRFLDVGFQSDLFLDEVVLYANNLLERNGKQWPELYIYIMRYMMLNGRRKDVLAWHSRLIRYHVPSPKAFRGLVHDVLHGQGDQEALKMLYSSNNHRHLYDVIISILTGLQDFEGALSWHFILMGHGDFPFELEIVDPLIQHYALQVPSKAAEVKRSLVSAGLSFASKISISQDKNIICRETTNPMLRKSFGISQKKYNDGLAARWLATRWVSLDLAISALHALGVKRIGPLSLQAIALREDAPQGILYRINQLRELGISTGTSVYSKAIESFARNKELEYLHGLLQSDRSPESLEDWKGQETLLAAYAREENWVQFRRTMAIRVLDSFHPETDRYNITLRVHITNGDRTALLRTLEEMRMSGFTVKPTTIRYLLCEALPRRRKGHAPDSFDQRFLNMATIISVLKGIANSNSNMPLVVWRGTLRRLGMLGQLNELDRLCMWLVAWCKSRPGGRPRPLRVWPTIQLIDDERQSASGSRSFQDPHPLQELFSDEFQQALVEWGFIHQPIYCQSQPSAQSRLNISTGNPSRAHEYARGLRRLGALRNDGIVVNTNRIRRVVLNRLALLHGPRASNSNRNRILKEQNQVSLENMVEQINRDWGEQLLPDISLVRKRVQKA